MARDRRPFDITMIAAGTLEVADLFVLNQADHAGESKLARERLDTSNGRPICETIATRDRDIAELVEAVFPGTWDASAAVISKGIEHE